MLLTCKISGMQLTRYQHFAGLHLEDVHPIFQVKPRILWRLADSFYKKDTTEEERNLLFLALAYNTGRVIFRVPGKPSAKLVHNCFPKLCDMAGWLEKLQAPGVHFPSFVVNSATQDMKNIDAWLDALMQVRKEFYEGQARQEHKQRMMRLQEKIETGILYSATNSTRGTRKAHSSTLNRELAEWALDACDAPSEQYNCWYELLTMPESQLLNRSQSDMRALLDHFELYLPHGSSAAAAAMSRARALLETKANTLGLFEILDEDYDENSNPVISSEVAATPIAQAAFMDAPETEPRREQYPDAVSYSVARARWILARNLREQHASSLSPSSPTTGADHA